MEDNISAMFGAMVVVLGVLGVVSIIGLHTVDILGVYDVPWPYEAAEIEKSEPGMPWHPILIAVVLSALFMAGVELHDWVQRRREV